MGILSVMGSISYCGELNSASGSTGGWEALAVQIFYPDRYNGAFAACPDPVDFRAYTVIDIYKDKNADFMEGAHKRIAQPAMRDYLGHVTATQQDVNYYELALGTNSRYLGSRLFTGGEGWLSGENLRQSQRRDPSRGCRVLA